MHGTQGRPGLCMEGLRPAGPGSWGEGMPWQQKPWCWLDVRPGLPSGCLLAAGHSGCSVQPGLGPAWYLPRGHTLPRSQPGGQGGHSCRPPHLACPNGSGPALVPSGAPPSPGSRIRLALPFWGHPTPYALWAGFCQGPPCPLSLPGNFQNKRFWKWPLGPCAPLAGLGAGVVSCGE